MSGKWPNQKRLLVIAEIATRLKQADLSAEERAEIAEVIKMVAAMPEGYLNNHLSEIGEYSRRVHEER